MATVITIAIAALGVVCILLVKGGNRYNDNDDMER